jgi:selenocysteine lyase/cysteine desulfurase
MTETTYLTRVLKNQRNLFSLPPGAAYLNCAYMSPLLLSVEKAGISAMQRKRNPANVSAEDFFTESDLLRKEFASLIGVRDHRRIVLIPSVSYGMAVVTRNISLRPGQNVVVASEQFPSNYYPWWKACETGSAELRVVAPPLALEGRGRGWNQRLLEAIDINTRVVALGHVHWADGTKFDLARIRQRSKEVGALLIIDGTQSVGALPFRVPDFQPDALVCAGYKWLMGPYSLGLAYLGEVFDGGVPIEENWINRLHSEDFAGLVRYQREYQPGALRYEVGEHSNFILVPMLLRAIRQIREWKPSEIQKYTAAISGEAIACLRENEFWVEDSALRGAHLFGIRRTNGLPVKKLKTAFAKANISVSVRGDCIRVGPHVYNSKPDLERLAGVLVESVRR